MAMESKKSDYNFGKVDVDTIDPGKCQTNFGWNDLQIAFVNKLNATMGAAKLPVDYIVCSKWDDTDEPFLDDDKMRRFQKPLTGENFKCANKLVYQMLKSACVKSDAWTWLQSFNCTADGKKAWLALVGHYDGTGELNERVKRPKQEIARLLYKDEKIFPFEIHVTKFKENFYVLEKDKNKDLTGKEQVYIFLRGIRSTNTCIQLAEVNVLQDFRGNFESVAEFLSSLIANLHASAQLDYANRHAGKVQRYVNAMGYNNQRGGRGRARQGNCCFGQRGGRSSGRTRDGRGRKGRGNGVAHSPTTLISPIPTEMLPLTSGGGLARCAHTFCNCAKAAVVAMEGGIAVTMTLPPLKQPAVLLQQGPTTQTMLIAETMRPLTSPLCLTLLSVDLRMAEALAVARTLGTRLPLAHTHCKSDDLQCKTRWLQTAPSQGD